ncbi:MAG: EamA family transporter [Spirochaetales bacterium]|nr:EamA family transporter [Spirochaetales bacterium]
MVVMFVLATVFPAMKSVTGQLSPLSISFFRYFFGVLPLIPLYLLERRRLVGPVTLRPATLRRATLRRDQWMMSLLGIPGIALFSICLTFGIKLSTACNGSLLANTQPIFTTLLAPLIIKEDFSRLRLVASLSGVAGVALVVIAGVGVSALGTLAARRFLWGNLILVGGALSISIYSILLKRYVVRYGGFVPTFLSMLSGAAVLFVVALIVLGRTPFSEVRGRQWVTLLYIGVIGTALVYPLFNLALKSAGVVRAVGFKLLIPVFGIALSYLLLGERPAMLSYVGAAVVIGSVLLIQRDPARKMRRKAVAD